MYPSGKILQHQYRVRNYQNYLDLIRDLLTMKNHHQYLVGSTPLSEVHHNVKGKEKDGGSSNHQKNFGKSKKDKHNNKTRKTNSNDKVLGKIINLISPLSAINVVILITLQRNIEFPNIWLTCVKNLSKRLIKLKNHMKLSSMLNSKRLLLG
jgi:hypothetical protein